jgi:GT2 family glycosyltransferase
MAGSAMTIFNDGHPRDDYPCDDSMKPPLVSYIVITRNRASELCDCLSSLREQDYPRKQLIVVDNGSEDDTAVMVSRRFPEVELILLDTNSGVGGGRNRGLRAARGEICICIDDDARLLDPLATHHTVAYFRDDPGLACLAFTILNAKTGAEDPKSIPRADKRSIGGDYLCSYFCGAGFALRRTVFLDLGMFWEKLVYIGEELDYSYRLLDRGYRLVHTSRITVYHCEVPQARPRGQWIYFNARNRCWVAVRNLPWLYGISTSLMWWVITSLIGLRSGHFGFFLRGFLDALRGLPMVINARSCMGKEAAQALKELSGRRWL